MRAIRQIAPPLLLGLLLAAPGCMVPKSKYDALQKENSRLASLLDEKEKDMTTAQDSFRKRFEDASRELALYKGQASASQAEAEKARKAFEDAQKESKKFEDEIRALGVGEVRDGRLVLQDSVLFKLGEDTLSVEGKHALDKIAGAFKAREVLIQIDGHTDNTAIVKPSTRKLHGDNMGLSAHRALAVYRYLASSGIAERNMYIRGFGPSWPVAGSATPAAKAKNRRVEILFIPASMVRRAAPK